MAPVGEFVFAGFLILAVIVALLRFGRRAYEDVARSGDFDRYPEAERQRLEDTAVELESRDEAREQEREQFVEDAWKPYRS